MARNSQLKIINKLENEGVKFFNKERVEIRGSLRCGVGIEIDINTIFIGNVTLGDGVKIGSSCIINNSTILNNTLVKDFTLIEESKVEEYCIIGPYARLRPKSKIEKNVQIGNFVEIKKSVIGEGSRVNHMTFIGDTFVENNVTFGAGCITCNHDGLNHNSIIVRSGAYIGSGCNLVAPIEIGTNATIGSGSTITENVSSNSLTICRTKYQTTIKDWTGPRKDKNSIQL